MPFSTAPSDLRKILDPAVATTRASYSRMRRPWSVGYNAMIDVSAAALVAGVNSAAPNDATRVILMQGLGQAAAAAPFIYTVPTGALPQLPVTADVTEADDYLDCICLIYPGTVSEGRQGGNTSFLERIATGGGNVTRAMFRANTATTFAIASSYDGANYVDVPQGWTIEIQVPTAGQVGTVYDSALPGALQLRDFLAAGGAGKTGVCALNRIFA